MAHGKSRDLTIEFSELLPALSPPLRRLTHDRLELLLKLLHLSLQAMTLFLWTPFEFFGAEDLTLLYRRENQTRRSAQHRDAFLLSLTPDGFERLLVPLFDFPLDRLPTCPVVFSFKCVKNR